MLLGINKMVQIIEDKQVKIQHVDITDDFWLQNDNYDEFSYKVFEIL